MESHILCTDSKLTFHSENESRRGRPSGGDEGWRGILIPAYTEEPTNLSKLVLALRHKSVHQRNCSRITVELGLELIGRYFSISVVDITPYGRNDLQTQTEPI